jgi:predicted enzyme related to lactoylglutathione lyase
MMSRVGVLATCLESTRTNLFQGMTMTKKHHSINYIELPSYDLKVTKEFYGSLFGWTFTDWGDTYISIDGAGIDGGFHTHDSAKVQKPGVLIILYSENLEATLQAVEATGATITLPIFAFPGGRRFQFQDPSGNELAVWSE